MRRDRAPSPVPDFVPQEWVARYRDGHRRQRADLLAAELARIERSARHDTSILLLAMSMCTILLIVAVALTATATAGSLALVGGVLFAAFGTCLWLVHRARRPPTPSR